MSPRRRSIASGSSTRRAGSCCSSATGTGDGQFHRIAGLAVDPDDGLVVVDALNHRLQRFGSDGQFRAAFGAPGSNPGEFDQPSDVAVDRFGNIYVADQGNARVQKFAADGTFRVAWGGFGFDAGKFARIESIAVDAFGYVYTSERGFLNRLQKFGANGEALDQWTAQHGQPGDLACDAVGNLFLIDHADFHVQCYVPGAVADVDAATPTGVYSIFPLIEDPDARLGNYRLVLGIGTLTIRAPWVVPDLAMTVAEDLPARVPFPSGDSAAAASGAGYAIVEPPAHGTVTGEGKEWTYRPATNYSGPDAFHYVAYDEYGTSDPATVTVAIIPAIDDPLAGDVAATVVEDVPTTIPAAVVDPDGDSLTLRLVSPPSRGSVSIVGTNFVYRPGTNFSGFDGFAYAVSDGSRLSSTSVVRLAITDVNDAPVAHAQHLRTAPGVAVALTLGAFDVDGPGLSRFLLGWPEHGTLTGTPPDLVYTPVAGFVGVDQFGFRAYDGLLYSPAATIRITVGQANHPPVAGTVTIPARTDGHR